MILNKAENESQTQVANHLFFFYYLLCVAPPTLSRRTRRGKKRFAGAAVKIKFNKTKHAHVLLVLFVCKKNKKQKNEEAISAERDEERGRQHLLDVFSVGTQAGLGNIVEGYFSPVWSAVH